MSLAQPSSRQSPMYNPSGAFNPFGPQATLGSDQVFARASPGPPSAAAVATAAPDFIHAPQGRVPTSVASLAPPQVASRPESRPDFLRGFGVDIPEEEEPEEEEPPVQEEVAQDDVSEAAAADTTVASAEGTEMDGMSTVAQSRIHSRHVSKLSAALSLRSVGGGLGDESMELEEEPPLPVRSPAGELQVEDLDGDQEGEIDHDVDPDQEAVGEWTGSEDLRTTETSDDEVGCVLQLSLVATSSDVTAEHRRVVEPFGRGACASRASPSSYDASRQAGQTGTRDSSQAPELPPPSRDACSRPGDRGERRRRHRLESERRGPWAVRRILCAAGGSWQAAPSALAALAQRLTVLCADWARSRPRPFPQCV